MQLISHIFLDVTTMAEIPVTAKIKKPKDSSPAKSPKSTAKTKEAKNKSKKL